MSGVQYFHDITTSEPVGCPLCSSNDRFDGLVKEVSSKFRMMINYRPRDDIVVGVSRLHKAFSVSAKMKNITKVLLKHQGSHRYLPMESVNKFNGVLKEWITAVRRLPVDDSTHFSTPAQYLLWAAMATVVDVFTEQESKQKLFNFLMKVSCCFCFSARGRGDEP